MSTAAIYCRISQDARDEDNERASELGVKRQLQDCHELAQRMDLTVVEVYTDNDVGASTRSRKKTRPQFDAMMAAARAGRFGTVLGYSNSRLTRRPLEVESLIELHERYGVRIVTVVSGEDDLSTADGRMIARIKGSVDAGEAERTAERVARKHKELALAGKPVGGTRPFGWEDDHATIREAEAALIRDAAKAVVEGVPLRRIVRSWNDAGITSPRGCAWSPQTLRQLLRSPRLAGWRVYQGGIATDATGSPVRGQWEPILEQATADAVRAVLTRDDTRSRKPRKGARHYFLTGILRCGVCNGPMYGNAGKGNFGYICQADDHSNTGSGNAIDYAIGQYVLARLATEELSAPAPAAPTERLDEIKGQIAELMDAFTARRLSAAVVFGAVETLEAERDALVLQHDQETARFAGPALSILTEDTWNALDTDRQRAIAEKLFEAVLLRPNLRLS